MDSIFHFLQALSPAVLGLAGLWMAIEARSQRRARNKEIEATWTAKPEALASVVPNSEPSMPINASQLVETMKAERQHKQMKVGNRVVWCVIGEFNSAEALDNLQTLCLYFERLGKKGLADKLWAEAAKEYNLGVGSGQDETNSGEGA